MSGLQIPASIAGKTEPARYLCESLCELNPGCAGSLQLCAAFFQQIPISQAQFESSAGILSEC